MDLRSSTRSRRSKSKTPFTLTNSEQDYMEEKFSAVSYSENIRTTSSIVKTTNGNSSFERISEEQNTNSASTKPSISKRNKRLSKVYKTSDYSSEEENEVSSTRSITENDRNRIVEDAKKAADTSTGITALGLYRRAKRYWEEYPKTDWTYSRYSKDRVEIAPGVVAMPNMSRRHISSYDKYTNTDSFGHTEQSSFLRTRRILETNSFYSVVKSTFLRVLVSIVSIVHLFWKPFSYVYRFTHTACITVARGIYLGTSAIMLLDTWLLRSNRNYGKAAALTALCVVPFLLIGGLWLSLGNGESNRNSSSSIISSEKNVQESLITPEIFKNGDESSTPKKPGLSDNLGYSLTEKQLEEIALYLKAIPRSNEKVDYDEITNHILKTETIQKVVDNLKANPRFFDKQGDIEKTVDNQRESIDRLESELRQLKLEIMSLKNRQADMDRFNLEIQKGTTQKMDYFLHQLNRCCRKSLNLETHVFKTFVAAMNNPKFLHNQKGLAEWLNSLYVAKTELETRISVLTGSLSSNFDSLLRNNSQFLMDQVATKLSFEFNKKFSEGKFVQGSPENKMNISEYEVRRIVRDTLNVYDADKTGLVDYAMEPMGGQVITTRCTESYHAGTAVVSVFGLPLWYPVASPRTVITPGINPGKCWAFQNFPGLLVIKLMVPIEVEALSYEHVSKLLVPNGKIDSAPKDFEVYGLDHENDRNGVRIGSYRYEYNGESLQFFPAVSPHLVFQYIELRVISNHGNPNYTCLYRFRVHGKTVAS